MKTKYIKVAVSDELPKESGKYSTSLGECEFYLEWSQFYHIGLNKACYPEFYYIEVPDHEGELVAELKNARVVIGKLKRSIAVHPDCTEDSEFDDYSTMAQECEDDIESLIQKLKSDES